MKETALRILPQAIKIKEQLGKPTEALEEAKKRFERRLPQQYRHLLKYKEKRMEKQVPAIIVRRPLGVAMLIAFGFKGQAGEVRVSPIPKDVKTPLLKVEITVNQKLPRALRKEVARLAMRYCEGEAEKYRGMIKKLQIDIIKGSEKEAEAIQTAKDAGFGRPKVEEPYWQERSESPTKLVFQKNLKKR